MACQCKCGFNAVDAELVKVLEDVMDHFEEEQSERLVLIITSGNRCDKHNRSVGGAINSMHTKGMGCDFRIRDIPEDEVADYLEATYPDTYGIGRYTGRTHLDVRPNPVRWDKR